MNEQEFWIVWSPTGGNPTVRHDNWDSAIKEAERLAGLDFNRVGERFYVMQAQAVCTTRSRAETSLLLSASEMLGEQLAAEEELEEDSK